MKYYDARLIVFARAPQPGQAKTRLIPRLGPQGAASLQARLARHTLTTATQAGLCPVELWCAPTDRHPFFQHCREEFGVTLHTQVGRGLGERMSHALAGALQQHTCAVIIGTDCPTLTPHDLVEAFAALYGGYDAVLGPAEDGGYVLLGLGRYAPDLFEGMAWGTHTVLGTTRARLSRMGWRWRELAVRQDIDRPADIDQLAGVALS